MSGIRREEIIGGQRLILGDCLEVLLTLEVGSVDAVITDTPWLTTDFAFECTEEAMLPVFPEMVRVLSPCGYAVAFGTLPVLSVFLRYFNYRWTGVWLKPNGTPRFHNSHIPPSRTELIGVFNQRGAKATACHWSPPKREGEPWTKAYRRSGASRNEEDAQDRRDPRTWSVDGYVGTNDGTRCMTDVFEGPSKPYMAGEERTPHPTQKPVRVLCDLVEALTCATATVLDPFMGSGTTLVAAELLGRRGVGIEIDEGYFDIACRRVEEAVAKRKAQEAQLTLAAE